MCRSSGPVKGEKDTECIRNFPIVFAELRGIYFKILSIIMKQHLEVLLMVEATRYHTTYCYEVQFPKIIYFLVLLFSMVLKYYYAIYGL